MIGLNNVKITNIKDNTGNEVARQNERMLMNNLKKLDEAYKAVKANRIDDYVNSLPEKLELERISYDAPTDEHLKSQAEIIHLPEFEKERTKLFEQIETTRHSLSKSKENLSQAQKDTLANLDKMYERVKENIGNQALKRGLGRSSIVVNKITSAELSRAEKAGIIESDTRIAIESLDRQIESLERKKQDSLKAFDLSYAAKVEKELAKLVEDREKKIQAVVDYNNKVAKEETKFQEDRADKIDNYKDKVRKEDISEQEYYNKYGYKPSMLEEHEERYNMAYDFYINLPAETAKRILSENKDLEKYLGTKYYNKLKTIIVMRK